MDLNSIIAKNLNKLRTERNLSLGQLSNLSGISKVMLSQIEKEDANPSINTIWKIANGLKIPYTKLLEEFSKDTVVIKKADSIEQENETENYRAFCYFANNRTRNFEFFRIEIDPFSSNKAVGHSDKTEEYIYVLKGKLILETKGIQYKLSEGDAICFDSSFPHIYINQQNTMLMCIAINYYL